MAKKYEIQEEEPQMVSESVAVSYNSSVALKSNVYPIHSSDNVEPYTIEELDNHLEESEMQFMAGNFLSMEEADRDMDLFVSALRCKKEKRSNTDIARTLARTPEEYEDMKAHDFYSKGTPFPEQPQTWEEVWKEVDNQEEEIYLDETESNKAMEKLWSVLA